MTRIANTDQILMLLRAHLERLQKQKKSGGAQSPQRASPGAQAPLERVRELAAAGLVSEPELGRALVATLLAQEFGVELSNEIAFQALVERVNEAIVADPDTAELMRQAISALAGNAQSSSG